jgi:uncharacterized protein (DUF2062 family)
MTRAKLRRALTLLLHAPDSPHRTALAFGIGVWIAFFPLLGIHTGMALLIAFAFRLSRVAILAGAYVNNPWTLVPLYMAGTGLGCLLLGVPLSRLAWPATDGAEALLAVLKPLLWPYVVGNTVLGVAAGIAGYFALRRYLEARRTRQGE